MVSTNTPTDQAHSSASYERAAKPDRDPISAPTAERQALTRIAHALQAGQNESVNIAVGDGPAFEVPPSLLRVLRRGVSTLAHDDAVTMGQVGKLLTIHQAAELLLVSYSDVIQLLDSGDLVAAMAGQDRRIPLDNLLAYREEIARRRRASMEELTRLSEELGLYDLDRDAQG